MINPPQSGKLSSIPLAPIIPFTTTEEADAAFCIFMERLKAFQANGLVLLEMIHEMQKFTFAQSKKQDDITAITRKPEEERDAVIQEQDEAIPEISQDFPGPNQNDNFIDNLKELVPLLTKFWVIGLGGRCWPTRFQMKALPGPSCRPTNDESRDRLDRGRWEDAKTVIRFLQNDLMKQQSQPQRKSVTGPLDRNLAVARSASKLAEFLVNPGPERTV